jgi:hypothetical protein
MARYQGVPGNLIENACTGRKRGNILATNAEDRTFHDALDARRTRVNTGQNGVVYAVLGEPIPLSRR